MFIPCLSCSFTNMLFFLYIMTAQSSPMLTSFPELYLSQKFQLMFCTFAVIYLYHKYRCGLSISINSYHQLLWLTFLHCFIVLKCVVKCHLFRINLNSFFNAFFAYPFLHLGYSFCYFWVQHSIKLCALQSTGEKEN